MKIAEARKYEMITTTHQNEKQNLLKQQKAELDSVYLEIIDKNKEEFNKELTELQDKLNVSKYNFDIQLAEVQKLYNTQQTELIHLKSGQSND